MGKSAAVATSNPKFVLYMQACSGSLDRAADWLFSHADDLDTAVASVLSQQQASSTPSAGPSSSAGGRLLSPRICLVIAMMSWVQHLLHQRCQDELVFVELVACQ